MQELCGPRRRGDQGRSSGLGWLHHSREARTTFGLRAKSGAENQGVWEIVYLGLMNNIFLMKQVIQVQT